MIGDEVMDGQEESAEEISTAYLGFDVLRKANLARMPEFKNAHGEPAHSEPDGSDWTPAQWLQALLGELGEYANKRKKFERGDISEAQFRHYACKELADVMIYLDILSYQLGIDLAMATAEKFNLVSDRIGCQVKLVQNRIGEYYVSKGRKLK